MKKILYSLVTIAIALVLVTVAALIFKLNVPVTGLIKTAAVIINLSTDKEMSIGGSVSIVPGTWIDLKFEDAEITVSDPQRGHVAAKIQHASVVINLRSLLKKQVEINHLSTHDLTVDIMYRPEEIIGESVNEHHDIETLQHYSSLLKQISNVDAKDTNFTIAQKDSSSPFVLQLGSITGSVGEKLHGQLNVDGFIQSHKIGVNLKIDPLKNITHNSAPIKYSADVRYLDAVLSATGEISHGKSGFQLNSDFDLKDISPSQLSSLWGAEMLVGKQEDTLFSCSGRITATPETMTVNVTSFTPGARNLNVSLSVVKDESGKLNLSSSIAAGLIDIDRLASVFQAAELQETEKEAKPEGNKMDQDISLISEMLTDKNIDLNLDVDSMTVAGKQVKGLTTHAIMTDGVIKDAPFSATLDNVSCHGQYSLDVTSELPSFQLQNTTNSWDLGASLKDSGLAEDIDVTIAESYSELKTSGRSLSTLLKNLEFTVGGSNGSLQLPDHNTGATLPVEIKTFNIDGQPGKETALEFNGQIAGNQISASAVIADLRGVPLENVHSVPYQMTVKREGASLNLEGEIPVPFNTIGTTASYDFSGSDVKSLEEIIRHELPFTGAYRVTGNLHIIPKGYQIQNLELAIGHSFIKGDLKLDTKSTQPRLSIELQAEKIQLADFKKDAFGESRTDVDENLLKNSQGKKGVDIEWSVPENFDAEITVEVTELFSGDEKLGSGSLQFALSSGTISLAPLHLSLPRGEIDAQFFMEPFGSRRLYTLSVDVEALDYGAVSRWYKPETDQSGILDLRSSIKANVPENEDFLSHADGFIDFCVQPENLRTGVIDLWAVNLVSYLLPIFMPTSESQLNCIAGRFNISDGKMKHEDLLADTSKIQVKGSVDVDFSRRWIDARLQPVPKRPQFYSLATPVQVRGRLDDLKIGVAKGGLLGTMIRVLTSYVAVPVQWAARRKVPVNGTSQCLQIYNQRLVEK